MLYREISEKFLEWKNNPNRRVLMVKGARQVGKTFAIDDFCKNNYRKYYYINFFENATFKSVFDGSLDSNTVLKNFSVLINDFQLIEKQTVFFLDEIQECPNARTALKFLNQDKRFDVIASGSMLGIDYKQVASYPVGSVDYLEMHSMSFYEFLLANKISKEGISNLRDCFDKKEPVPEAMHNKIMALFKEYIVVGGMPKVVQDFVDNQNFASVLKLQRETIADYLDDIAKYASGTEKAKARSCFLSIPRHLSKDYKKFRYSLVEANGTSRKFAGSLQWLFDAGIVNFCYNLERIDFPFVGYANTECFKVYMKDTGLLVSMLDDGTQLEILKGNLGLYKGAIYENIIAEVFAKNAKKLYYFEYKSQIEVDFITRIDDKITAIEVKSAENTKSKSLTSVLDNHNAEQGILLSSKNITVSKSGKVVSYPLYMAMFL